MNGLIDIQSTFVTISLETCKIAVNPGYSPYEKKVYIPKAWAYGHAFFHPSLMDEGQNPFSSDPISDIDVLHYKARLLDVINQPGFEKYCGLDYCLPQEVALAKIQEMANQIDGVEKYFDFFKRSPAIYNENPAAALTSMWSW